MNNLINSLSVRKEDVSFGGVPLKPLLEEYGTPLYLYDAEGIRRRMEEMRRCIGSDKLGIFYAMKANPNPHLLRILREEGAGIDAVSEGEVNLALRCGFSPDRILYTANHIDDGEMERVHRTGVLMNVGSLSRLEKFGRRFPGSDVCIRFNPEVVAGEFPQIQTGGPLSKFGILLEEVEAVKALAEQYRLRVVGLHKHTGSGIADTRLFLESLGNLLGAARGDLFPALEFIDCGGGFKVPYKEDEEPIDYGVFGREITALFSDFCRRYGRELTLFVEPGKYLVAEAGILAVQVNTLKSNRGRLIAGTDSGFPQMIRTNFYGAYHSIVNLSHPGGEEKVYDICGNICESGDFFAQGRRLPEIREGDYLALLNTGAYCYSMGSVYNLRPLPPEVLIDRGTVRLIRRGLSPRELEARIREECGWT